ncbi:MAG TPA: ester cyclase [Thermodesulfobacteriota bacterium]
MASNSGHGGTPGGPDAIRQVVTTFRAAFPDLRITIEDQVAEGDKVCSRATTRGTHRGAIFGIEPTGRSVTMTGPTLVRIVDGHLVESWVKNDVIGLMRQLGAWPSPRRASLPPPGSARSVGPPLPRVPASPAPEFLVASTMAMTHAVVPLRRSSGAPVEDDRQRLRLVQTETGRLAHDRHAP